MATYVNNNTYFTNTDSLGSTRLQTDSSGALAATCQNLPYGQQTNCTDVSPLHFTGKQYDSESGLDYFGARYYEDSLGRFMTPDWSATAAPVPYAKLDNLRFQESGGSRIVGLAVSPNGTRKPELHRSPDTGPQTLNLYVYATDNPTTLTDPSRHMPAPPPLSAGQDQASTMASFGWSIENALLAYTTVEEEDIEVTQKATKSAKKAQQEKGSVPALVGGILNSLPNGKPVSGAEISKEINAAAESAGGLSAQAQRVLANISSVTKKGNIIIIRSTGTLAEPVPGSSLTVHIGKAVSFSYRYSHGALSFRNIRGLGVSFAHVPLASVRGAMLGQTGYTVTARIAFFLKKTLSEPY